MRRITTAISAAALSLGMALGMNLGVTQAATPGYDSAYQFESAFLTLKTGDSGTFSVFFANTGTTSWVAGTGTQVNLAVCAADKVTCNVTSAQAAWASGWLSSTAYATATKSAVAPGDFSAFTYNVKVPAGTTAGTYRFNGDLVVGATGDRIHPEGYYQDASLGTTGTGGTGITVTPAYSANETNEASTAIPGNGQHTYTFQVTGLTGTVAITLLSASNIVRNADGTFAFDDDSGSSNTGDKKADQICPTEAQITAINGGSISAAGCVVNQAIPSSGTITVTVDSNSRVARYRVVMWQDLNNNGQIDLSNAGQGPTTTAAEVFGNYDATTDGAIAVSGRKYWMGPQGTFGTQFATSTYWCDTGATPTPTQINGSGMILRHDSTNQVFDVGSTSGTGANGVMATANAANAAASLRFYYDSNDIFRINGVQTTLAQFKGEIDADSAGVDGDAVNINYNPDPAGISEFNITCNHGADAPDAGDGGSNPVATVGDFDAGGTSDDVQIQFNTPDFGTVNSYQIQRANAVPLVGLAGSCSAANVPSANYTTIGTVSPAGTQGSFTDFDRTAGNTYCYRVRVQDPVTAAENFSIVITQPIGGGGGDTGKPFSNNTVTTASSAGLANTLDTGDKIAIYFNESMSIAPNAVIRVTDSDCGQWTNNGVTPFGVGGLGTPNTGTQTPGCTGGNTNTVADIICGTNATCTANNLNNQTNADLLVTMTGNPTIVAAGSVAGAQYSVLITDSTGITDLAGNSWSLQASPDRVFGPQGN